ncbi:hypothetical protein ABKN59_003964 [Abortiporus biennis]
MEEGIGRILTRQKLFSMFHSSCPLSFELSQPSSNDLDNLWLTAPRQWPKIETCQPYKRKRNVRSIYTQSDFGKRCRPPDKIFLFPV